VKKTTLMSLSHSLKLSAGYFLYVHFLNSITCSRFNGYDLSLFRS